MVDRRATGEEVTGSVLDAARQALRNSTVLTSVELTSVVQAAIRKHVEVHALVPMAADFSETWDQVAEQVHRTAIEKGFWEHNPSDGEKIALMHGELSEMLEALRGDPTAKDKHCPQFSNVEVEGADLVIRLMDWAEQRGYDIAGAMMAKMAANRTRPHRHGKRF